MEPHAPIDDEAEEEEFVDEEEVPRPLKRSAAGKGIMDLRCEEDYEEELDVDVMGQPDLGDYFGQWAIPPSSEIALCRTYANYLASKIKAARK